MDHEPSPYRTRSSYLGRMLVRYGIVRAVLLSCVLAFGAATAVMVPINMLTNGSLLTGLIVTLVICTTIVPLHSYHIFALLDQIERAHQALYLVSVTDELTGAYNRRYFLSQVQRQLSRADGGGCAIVLFDIDNFKRFNDSYGHDAGDAMLRAVSRVCRESSRQDDLFARYGGEEFAFLLPSTGAAQAAEFAERIRQVIAGTPIGYEGLVLQCTVSIGVKVVEALEGTPDSALIAADRALYDAKAAGKNRIVVAQGAPGAQTLSIARPIETVV